MHKTIAFVTNQHRCDRLIRAASSVASETGTELMVVGILDCEYALDPEAIDYLFLLSKENKATMRLLFTEEKRQTLREITADAEVQFIITGLPGSRSSVLYDLWREFPGKTFYTADFDGNLTGVETLWEERNVCRGAHRPCTA